MATTNLTNIPNLNITQQVEWCNNGADKSIEAVVAGQCNFVTNVKKAPQTKLSSDVFWLRLTLHNPAAHNVERWLSVSQKRLRLISLYQQNINHTWYRTDTGLSVPIQYRPLLEPHPLLPIILAPNETKTYYIRVANDNSTGLNTELWQPRAYTHLQHTKENFQMLAIGGLMMVSVLALMTFFKTREKYYLYFGAGLASAILQDADATGLLQMYMWPSYLPYPLQLQVLTFCLTLGLFMLFVLDFLDIQWSQETLNLVLLASYSGLMLTALWICIFDYDEATHVLLPLFAICIVIGWLWLVYKAWRKNSSLVVGYLIVSFSALSVILIFQATMMFGLVEPAHPNSQGFAWHFLLISPFILAAMLKRKEELDKAFIQAQAEVMAGASFMTKMSHEFRSPLNTILGYAELQERGILNTSPEASASNIKHSGRQLLNMIDEIIEYSRCETGQLRLNLTPVNWGKFIAELRQDTEMMIKPRGNHFQLIQKGQIPMAVVIDEHRLRQVLDNLLSNANNFSSGGIITLNCHATPIENDHTRLNFSIHDTGTGISPEEIKTIFLPFMRGSAGKSSGIDGIGMGLAISQQLVQLMHGNINIKSKLAIGSTFSFSIECELAEIPTNTVKFNSGYLPKQYKILLVDDDSCSQYLLSLLLSNYGFDVITADSGNAARQYLDQTIDLVITDQLMHDGDGWTVLQNWSALNVPVMLLSAASPQRPEGLIESFQFCCIQIKPFDADALLATITNVLSIEWLPVNHIDAPSTIKAPVPPQKMLVSLKKMIEDGSVTDINEWLNTFSERYPEYNGFCAKISKAYWELDFDELRRLTTEN